MRIDIRGSRELQDVAIALKAMDRDVRRVIRTYTKAELTQPWLQSINQHASTPVEKRVIAGTATVAVSDQNIKISAAAKGRRLSGGMNPKTDYAAVEFGASREKKTRYVRKGHQVERRTARQMKPRNQRGYVFYPAATEMIPRLARLWVQTVVKLTADIFEGKA